MSGHRPFVELTKHFDDEHRKRVAERYAELRSVLLLYESPEDKERKYKVPASLIRTYRCGPIHELTLSDAHGSVTLPVDLLESGLYGRSKIDYGVRQPTSIKVARRVAPPDPSFETTHEIGRCRKSDRSGPEPTMRRHSPVSIDSWMPSAEARTEKSLSG